MISQAAASGLGVALVPKFFIEEELAAGTLVRLFDISLKLSSAYHFVYPENRTLRPVVNSFKAWLQEEAHEQQVDRETLLPQ